MIRSDSQTVEKIIAGLAVAWPEKAIPKLVEGIEPAWLLNPAWRHIYEKSLEMWNAGRPVSLGTVTEEIITEGKVTDPAWTVTDAYNEAAPLIGGIGDYIKRLGEKKVLRESIRIAEDIIYQANHAMHPDEITQTVNDGLSRIAGLLESKAEIKPIKNVVMSRMDHYEEIAKNRGAHITGLPTGIYPLDKLLGGLRPGTMTVLGARYKGGKTALAAGIALAVANSGAGVGIVTLEMSAEEIVDRLLAAQGEIDFSKVEEGMFNKHDSQRVISAVDQLAQMRIFIRDEAVMKPLQFRAACRRMKLEHSVQFIVLDYLQLVEPSSREGNREQQVADASRTCKLVAKELGIPLLVLCQLNANGDARESKAIMQDCDSFMVIESEESDAPTVDAKIRVRLNRSRPTGEVEVTFQKPYSKFEAKY